MDNGIIPTFWDLHRAPMTKIFLTPSPSDSTYCFWVLLGEKSNITCDGTVSHKSRHRWENIHLKINIHSCIKTACQERFTLFSFAFFFTLGKSILVSWKCIWRLSELSVKYAFPRVFLSQVLFLLLENALGYWKKYGLLPKYSKQNTIYSRPYTSFTNDIQS